MEFKIIVKDFSNKNESFIIISFLKLYILL